MKKKQLPADAKNERHRAAMETELFRDYLAVMEHLAVTRYEDGDCRKVGHITLTTDGPLWVCYCKDPDSRMSFRLTASTIDELMEALQELLDTETSPWQPDDYLEQKASKGRKK